MKTIILASASPRRRELLSLAGYTFTVQVSNTEEIITKTLPSDIVCELSMQKAAAVAALQKDDCIVIGSDTLVAFDNNVMGKPKDRQDAIDMIHRLSGHIHQVYSGVTIVEITNGKISNSKTFYEQTDVHVLPMTDSEIEAYVDCGECMDKAGAYGIQGRFAIYINKIDGDYYNVMGLPISRLHRELKEFNKSAV